MRILITGITGFAGSHLAKYILREFPKEHAIYGTKRHRSRMDNVTPELRDLIRWAHDVDYTDAGAVDTLIKQTLPDRVFHLSAESFVPTSWMSPGHVINNNVQSQVNLFNSILKYVPRCRIQIACSSEEYGLVFPDECPIKETNPLRPLSPYAVSKVTQDFLGYQYYRTHKLYVVRTRAFNHTGPGRGHVFVCSTFAKQIAEIEAGLQRPELYVGNLDAVRDFTDVRDMVRAYWYSLCDADAFGAVCVPGEVYNIGTGVGYTIENVVNILLDMCKLDVKKCLDTSRLRPSDVERLICDSAKFREATGWLPKYELKETLRDLLQDWREKT